MAEANASLIIVFDVVEASTSIKVSIYVGVSSNLLTELLVELCAAEASVCTSCDTCKCKPTRSACVALGTDCTDRQ